MTALLIVLLALVLLLLRQSLFVVLGSVTAAAYFSVGEAGFSNLVLDSWGALNREVLLAIPLYILAGNIMAHGAMAGRLVGLMEAATGHLRGGLGIATVLSCAAFAAVTGSGTVTLLAVGAVMYPALLKAGYPKALALGLLCAAGTLGIVIPPSIPLILYGVMTQTSIADLFIAGIGPALLLTGLMLVYVRAAGHRLPVQPFDAPSLRAGLRSGALGLLMPVIILGGIYTGYFTPTESAAVAVVYALLVELCVYREMTFKGLLDTVSETGALLGGLFPVLLMAVSFTVFLTYQQVPEQVVGFLAGLISSEAGFLIATNLLLLLVGCVMDIGSAILILAPILQPVAASHGIDPVHFGVMMVVNLEIGYLTPPLGLNIIVAMGAFREDFWTVCKAMLPFVLLMLAGLLVIAWWPALSLFLLG